MSQDSQEHYDGSIVGSIVSYNRYSREGPSRRSQAPVIHPETYGCALNNDDRQFYMARDNSYDIVNGGIGSSPLLRITSSTGYGIITASRLLLYVVLSSPPFIDRLRHHYRFTPATTAPLLCYYRGHSVLCSYKT